MDLATPSSNLLLFLVRPSDKSYEISHLGTDSQPMLAKEWPYGLGVPTLPCSTHISVGWVFCSVSKLWRRKAELSAGLK